MSRKSAMSQPALLLRAWIALLVFSAGSTLLSLWDIPTEWKFGAGVAILTLSWLKARIILQRYLGLAQAPFWARGFNIGLALSCLLFLGLYLVPVML